MARLQQIYREKIVPELKASLGLENPMQVPKITRITVNMGVGEAVGDKKAMDGAVGDRAAITRSRSSPNRASRSRRSSCVRACRSAPR